MMPDEKPPVPFVGWPCSGPAIPMPTPPKAQYHHEPYPCDLPMPSPRDPAGIPTGAPPITSINVAKPPQSPPAPFTIPCGRGERS